MGKLDALINSRRKWHFLIFLVMIFLPLAVRNDYYLDLIILVMMWSVLGMSWNLLGGFTGQVSFGHAVFFGVGAYTACLLHVKLGVSLWIGFIMAGIAASLIAIPIGLICFRLRGPYFALSVLALSEVLRLLTLYWKSLTEGAVGILLISPVIESKIGYYYLIFALLILTALIISYIIRTRAGFYFMAIREEEEAAESLGIMPVRYKLLSLVISAFFTGMVGCFFANYTTFIDPYIVFSIVDISIAVVLVVALGGIGTFWGPVVGALVVVLFSEGFRNIFAEAHVLVYGALIIIVILFLPEGIVGGTSKLYAKLSSQKEEQRNAA